MSETRMSIGQIRYDIAELVKRVAHGRERILLTAEGVPKAALIGIEEYERLCLHTRDEAPARWSKWRSQAVALRNAILERRKGEPVDVEALWQAARDDREERDARVFGHRR